MKTGKIKHQRAVLLLIISCLIGGMFAAYFLIKDHDEQQRNVTTHSFFESISSLPHVRALAPSYNCFSQGGVFETTYCATSFQVDFTNDQMDMLLKKLSDMGFVKIDGPPRNGSHDYFFLAPSKKPTTDESIVINNFLVHDDTWHLIYGTN